MPSHSDCMVQLASDWCSKSQSTVGIWVAKSFVLIDKPWCVCVRVCMRVCCMSEGVKPEEAM